MISQDIFQENFQYTVNISIASPYLTVTFFGHQMVVLMKSLFLVEHGIVIFLNEIKTQFSENPCHGAKFHKDYTVKLEISALIGV